MADAAILAAGGANAPLSYLVPGASVIRIKQIHVKYVDDGAGGDWLPAVRITSDSSHRMGTAADQAVKVTAGDDADVSFFPGVKHGGGQQPTFYVGHGEAWTFNNQTIADSTVTAIQFEDTDSNADGDSLVVQLQAPPFTAFSIANRAPSFGGQTRVLATLIVEWPAGSYDRYAEIVHTGTQDPWGQPPARVRGSVSPASDVQVVTRVLSATAGLIGPAVCNVYQASGSGKLILAALFLVEQTNGSP